MSIQMKLAISLVTFLSVMAFTTTASAQAGLGCGQGGLAATECGLGGQIRGQIGDGLPIPISIAPGYTGPFLGGTYVNGYNNAVIHTQPATPNGNPIVGQGLGQPGQVKPNTQATIMQTLGVLGSQGRAVSQKVEQYGYGPQAEGSIGVINFNNAVFAVQTNLIFDSPHPGTNGTGVNVSVPGISTTKDDPARILSPKFSKGLAGGGTAMQGRTGAITVSFYAGATLGGGSPTNNYGQTSNAPLITAKAGNAAGINGVARFVATSNQFGGTSTGRTLGTAKVYFNNVSGGLNPAVDLPCTGTAMCAFGLSQAGPATTGVAGGPFGGSANNAAFSTLTGVFTGTIGFNGTIVAVGDPITTGAGLNSPFVGQQATSVGFPVTTGMLSITVTSMLPADPSEMWVRTGLDRRTAGGNGVIATVTGTMSARNISKGNANRTWSTIEIPEPGAIAAASAGLLALIGCHQLVRRRNR